MTKGRVAITTRTTTKTIIKPRIPVQGQARLGKGLQVSAQLSLKRKARRHEHGYSFYHLQFLVVVVVVATTSCQNSKFNTLHFETFPTCPPMDHHLIISSSVAHGTQCMVYPHRNRIRIGSSPVQPSQSQRQSPRFVVVQLPEHKIRMMQALGRIQIHSPSQSTKQADMGHLDGSGWAWTGGSLRLQQ